MATVTLNSAAIANIEASPQVKNDAFANGAPIRFAQGWVSLSTGDSATSTMAFVEVPSNALITSMRLFIGANGVGGGTTTSVHLGAWSPTRYGGGVIDNDCFATAVTATAQAVTEIVHEANVSGTSAPNGMEKRVWQVAGLPSDPQHPITIKGQLSGAVDNTASLTYMGVAVEYVV